MIKFINNGDTNVGILIMIDGEPEIHSLKATPDGTIMHNDEHNADKCCDSIAFIRLQRMRLK